MVSLENTNAPCEQERKRLVWSEVLNATTIPIGAAIISAVGGWFAAHISYESRAQELNLKYVEMGVAILRADPKEQNTAKVRTWAFKIVNTYAPIKFSEEEKNQILNNAVNLVSYNTYTTSYDSTYTPPYDSKRTRGRQNEPADGGGQLK